MKNGQVVKVPNKASGKIKGSQDKVGTNPVVKKGGDLRSK